MNSSDHPLRHYLQTTMKYSRTGKKLSLVVCDETPSHPKYLFHFYDHDILGGFSCINDILKPQYFQMLFQFLSFLTFTAFVAGYATWRLKSHNLNTSEGYFLGGRSLTGVVIAGSMLLTNISTEHLIGMNGSSYRNGALVITWEATSALALVIAAIYFVPKYLKMGLTTIPEFLEKRFDGWVRTIVALLLIISFVATLLPIVLYTGAINIESIFDLSDLLGVSKSQGIWITVLIVGTLGAIYAIFGGLKMVAYTDYINGFGLLLAGLLVPFIALYQIGDGNVLSGFIKVFNHAPEKFKVISDETIYWGWIQKCYFALQCSIYRYDYQSVILLDYAPVYSPKSIGSSKSEGGSERTTVHWCSQIIDSSGSHFTWHHRVLLLW